MGLLPKNPVASVAFPALDPIVVLTATTGTLMTTPSQILPAQAGRTSALIRNQGATNILIGGLRIKPDEFLEIDDTGQVTGSAESGSASYAVRAVGRS